jgi:radical SAM protein with 4Fe4S-binding SPASM domain
VRTHTNTTLNRLNFEDCLEMPRFVREVLVGERFSMNLMIPTGSGALNSGLVVTYEETAPHIGLIQEKSRIAGVEFMWYSPTPMCIFNPVARGLGNKGCSACDGLLSVAPSGDVLPCPAYDLSVGSLLREDFRVLWASREAEIVRNKEGAHPSCRNCEDFAVCHGACPLYWRQMGFSELERLGRFARGR